MADAPAYMSAPLPPDEERRLESLRRYAILDSAPEAPFDRIVRLAAQVIGTPIALISLVDEQRQWFKASVGLDARETGRDVAFCAHAILCDDVMVVPDASKDERFAHNPMVTGEPHIQFYAGAVLKTPDGHNIGTLCVKDTVPRRALTDDQKRALQDLADIAVDELEIRVAAGDVLMTVDERHNAVRRLATAANQLRLFIEVYPGTMAMFDREMRYQAVSKGWLDDFKLTGQDIIGRSNRDVLPKAHKRWEASIQRCLAGEAIVKEEDHVVHSDGTEDWFWRELYLWYTTENEIGGVFIFTERSTEEKLAERAFEQNKEFLNAVLDNVEDGIAACDANGRLTLFNRSAHRLIGLPEGGLPPEEWSEYYSVLRSDGRTRMATEELPLYRAYQGEKVRDARLIVHSKKGERYHLRVSGQPMFTRNGEKLGAVVSMHDTTKRELADERFRRSEERYRALYKRTPAMMFSIDADGHMTNVSALWLETLGYTQKEVVGRIWTAFLTPDSRAHAEQVGIPEYQKKGHCRDRAYQVVTKRGDIIDVLLSAVGEKNAEGAIEQTLAVMADVTERKKAEAALRLSEERFRGAFNTATHGIALVAPNGRWLAANNALCQILGYGEEELLEIDFQTITHPDDLDADLGFVNQVLTGEIPSYQMEKRYFHKDGTVIKALLSVSLVRDHDNNPLHFVSQIVDLTEHKNAEARLHQAMKMEAVGQLTGGLAHDFNNLLAVIMGNLQLLERAEKNDEKAIRRIGHAMEATTRGTELTKRLLAFSRKQALDPIVLDTGELVAGMTEMLSRTLGGTVELETVSADKLWLTQVDPNQLETAILNLAINARDAMPNGGHLVVETANVTLHDHDIKQHSYMVAGDYVRISVTDTGTGMPSSIVAQVFEPFFTTKEVGEGSGLGLSMVYGFVKQSGGHIHIYSEEGRGTTVTMYLPRYCGTQEPWRRDGEAETATAGGNESILVVEDDPSVREMAVSLLEEFGYRVTDRATGREALDVVRGNAVIDLLFSDIVLRGGMTGLELANEARKIRPELRILYTSGFASAAVLRDRRSPMHGELLNKPYRREELAKHIRHALDG